MKPHTLTTTDTAQMEALRLEGYSYAAIARQLGCTRQRVQQILSPPAHIKRRIWKDANERCQVCDVWLGKHGHIHHMRTNAHSPETYQDATNLQYLCASCHASCHRNSHAPESLRTDYVKTLSLSREAWEQLCLLARHDERSLRAVMARLVRHECQRLGLIPPNGAPAETSPGATQGEVIGYGEEGTHAI